MKIRMNIEAFTSVLLGKEAWRIICWKRSDSSRHTDLLSKLIQSVSAYAPDQLEYDAKLTHEHGAIMTCSDHACSPIPRLLLWPRPVGQSLERFLEKYEDMIGSQIVCIEPRAVPIAAVNSLEEGSFALHSAFLPEFQNVSPACSQCLLGLTQADRPKT